MALAAESPALSRRLALLTLFVVSAVGLIFEITLTRLFSLFFQYHFTFLAVSLAVLGLSLGAASVHYLQPRQQTTRALATVLIALSFALAGTALVIAWLPDVSSIFPRALVALVPFFLVGMVAALTFANFTASSGDFYAADLIGAALGVVAVLWLLSVWSAFSLTLFLAVMVGALALLVVERQSGRSLRTGVAALSLVVGVVLLALNLITGAVDYNPLALTGFPRDKTMVGILQDANQQGKIIDTEWSPFARVDVVQTNDHSARYLFADGGAGAYMLPYDGDPASLSGLANAVDYLPFDSGSANKTLVIGAGGGKDILLALNAGSTAITAVEVNPAVVSAARKFADYNGGVLDLPQVDLVAGDARSFVERSSDHYDLIYLSLVYTQAVEPASQALIENYIFTQEAFATYLDRLAPGGRLAIVAHNALEGSRAAVTALQAFENEGVPPAQALDHLWLWSYPATDQTVTTSVLIVGKDPLPTDTVQSLNTAAKAQGMNPLYATGDYEALFAPLRSGESMAGFIDADAAYNLAPTTDDQPYFFNLDYGIPPAIRSALVLAALLAAALVGVAIFTGGELAASERGGWRRAVVYALLIGIGFMLVEVPLIQRFQILLGQPILSLAVVLATLLLAGGLGSFVSQRWIVSRLPVRVMFAGGWIALVVVVYEFALPSLVGSLLPQSFAVRVAGIVGLTALLGFPMGIPFPSLMRLAGAGATAQRQQIALLWAINGAFSVLGSTLAVVISMLWGFHWALLIGAGCYLLLIAVAWSYRRVVAGVPALVH